MLGTTELLLLGGLALLIFGGKKVPEMMRGLGQGVKEFKNGMKDDDDIQNKDENVKASNEDSEIQPQSDNTKGQNDEQRQ